MTMLKTIVYLKDGKLDRIEHDRWVEVVVAEDDRTVEFNSVTKSRGELETQAHMLRYNQMPPAQRDVALNLTKKGYQIHHFILHGEDKGHLWMEDEEKIERRSAAKISPEGNIQFFDLSQGKPVLVGGVTGGHHSHSTEI